MHAHDAERQAAFRRRQATAAMACFTLNGSASLKTLAEFYGFRMPGNEPQITVGEYVARACDGRPRVGDRANCERVELIVREIEECNVRKVCFRIVA